MSNLQVIRGVAFVCVLLPRASQAANIALGCSAAALFGESGDGAGSCPAPGGCFEAHETPGCDDATCCTTVCTEDPFCCDVSWDFICVNKAINNCSMCPSCIGDIDGDTWVGPADLAIILGSWGSSDPCVDVSDDGLVGPEDVAILLGAWGACP